MIKIFHMPENFLFRQTSMVLLLLLAVFLTDTAMAENKQPALIAGVSHEVALRLGERMYRDGILPSGEPMQAVVEGDIPVDGKMFSCVSCHQRSGMGSYEGRVITLPINSTNLYRPLSPMGDLSRSARDKMPQWLLTGDTRPAYTDETLALVLRAGEDPGGRTINDIMPRYFLNDRDMEIMIYYLKNLSPELSPGVNDTTLHLATVITEDVSRQDREAMLLPLQRYAEGWGKSRHLELRAKKGPFTDEIMNKGYRKLRLSVWDLKGQPESWKSQLEEYYRNDPVFALLGGISTGEWGPIHTFCEDHKIPAILPVTDFPVISDSDWYTLYFSKGLYQEGEAAAKYLRRLEHIPDTVSVVQVFRNNRSGLALSNAFRKTWEGFAHPSPANRMLGQDEVITPDLWRKLTALHKDSIMLLWLDAKDLSAVGSIAEVLDRPKMVFASSSLLGEKLYSLPDSVRSFFYITYPYRLPQEEKRYKTTTETWLKNNQIPVTNLKTQSKMYFISSLLTTPLTMIQSNYYRDYFLELLDMMEDQTYTIAIYPRLSFGPGQRYASKGCYIVQLGNGPQPELIPRSDWVIY